MSGESWRSCGQAEESKPGRQADAGDTEVGQVVRERRQVGSLGVR